MAWDWALGSGDRALKSNSRRWLYRWRRHGFVPTSAVFPSWLFFTLPPPLSPLCSTVSPLTTLPLANRARVWILNAIISFAAAVGNPWCKDFVIFAMIVWAMLKSHVQLTNRIQNSWQTRTQSFAQCSWGLSDLNRCTPAEFPQKFENKSFEAVWFMRRAIYKDVDCKTAFSVLFLFILFPFYTFQSK